VTSSVWTASALLSNVATERRQGKELMLTHTATLVDMNTLDILPSNISTGLYPQLSFHLPYYSL